MKKIHSVGIIGFGFAGQLHAEIVKKISPDSTIYVTDTDAQKIKLAHTQGFIQCTELKTLLQQKPDVIITAVPPSENLQLTKYIVKHHPGLRGVLIEKPLALSAKDAKNIARIISNAGIVGMIGLTGHGFHPEFRRAKEIIDSGILGQILECNEHIYQGAPDFPPHYMTKEYGGAPFELGIHSLDHLLYLFHVEQWKVNEVTQGNPHWGSTANDWCRASLHGIDSDGNRINSQVSWAFTRYRADLTRENYATTILGTQGKLVIYGFDGIRLTTIRSGKEKVTEEWFHSKNATGRERHIPGFRNEVKSFLSAVENNMTPDASLEYGVRVHTVLDAIISP